MTARDQRSRAIRAAAEPVIGAASVALLTWGAFRLHADATTAALLYFCLVVLVSLRGRLFPALLVAAASIASLDYFFSPPIFSIALGETLDVVALIGFAGTALVITGLVGALRASERRWREVFENNPTMYFVVDPAGTVLSVNPTGAEQLGYTVDELVGRSVLGVFPDTEREAARDHVARCLTHLGQSTSWEIRKIRKDHTTLWVRETARAAQLAKGPPIVLIACEDITERKEAQERLRHSEAHLHEQAGLLDLTHDTVFVRDINDVITYWNRGAEERYGWTRAEAVGKVSHALMQTIFPAPLNAIDAELLRTGRWEGELVHTRRDGTRVVVSSRWALQRDESGHPIAVLETNNDITSRKRAEEGLRRSEAYLAEAQRLSRTGSFGWSLASGEIYWSDETYRIFQYDRTITPTLELVRQRVHPEDADAVRQTIEQAAKDGRDFHHAYRLAMPNGAVKHVHVVAHASRDPAGGIEFVGAVMDVTGEHQARAALEEEIEDRKRAEEALRRSERRYRYIFQTVGVSIWEEDFSQLRAAIEELKRQGVQDFRQYVDANPDFVQQAIAMVKIVDVNDASVEMFAAGSRDELLGSLHRIFVPETLDAFVGELLAIAEERTSFEEETVLQTLTGEPLTVLFTIAFPPSPAQFDSVLVTVLDITERKRAEEAAQRAQAELARVSRVTMLGEITASIAHEINQPLAAVVMNGNACRRWLAADPPDIAEAREAAQRVISDGERAGQIISRIRSLVRRRLPERSALDVNDVIREALTFTRAEMERHGVALRAELDDGVPAILGDRVQLQQVLVNLLLNAGDAMADVPDAARELTVGSHRVTDTGDAGGVLIEVRDRGRGIDRTEAERIFEPFFSTKPGGLGMGLSISRSIVEMHGGRIWAAPNDSGPGATMRFELPAAPDRV